MLSITSQSAFVLPYFALDKVSGIILQISNRVNTFAFYTDFVCISWCVRKIQAINSLKYTHLPLNSILAYLQFGVPIPYAH